MFCLNLCEIFCENLLEGKRLETLAKLALKNSGCKSEEDGGESTQDLLFAASIFYI